ncbi:hypothetical protein U8V72_14635 [Priestia filamentosa]|uniref:hypothetical protein n=1 Tax=Priestia filamentosa TaxID=1402861 RepID=UPI00397E1A1D
MYLDWFGIGQHRLKYRREHIKAYLALYDRLTQQLKAFKKPHQCLVTIHEEDASADAVYIHSPKLNDDYFPHKNRELNWEWEVPNTFKDLIDNKKYDVGYFKSEFEEVYVVQLKT